MEPEVAKPPRRKRRLASAGLARFFATAAFLVLVAGLTYFAFLVYHLRFGNEAARVAALRELGLFLTQGDSWFLDARVYGVVSLVLSLFSLLFGTEPLARVTVLVSGVVYLTFMLGTGAITELLTKLSY